MRFEVGDRVKIVDVDQSGGRMVFDKGLVIETSSLLGTVCVACDTWKNNWVNKYGVAGNWFLPSQLKKLKPKKKKRRLKRTGWINVYPLCNEKLSHHDILYADKDDAESGALDDRIACIFVTYEWEE
jgi:hypothetical protein